MPYLCGCNLGGVNHGKTFCHSVEYLFYVLKWFMMNEVMNLLVVKCNAHYNNDDIYENEC
jgi:hypothetical protein